MKILIIDDEIEIIEILSTLIESEVECEILKAESGKEAVSILDKHNDIDLILSDYNMPEGNGALVFEHNKKKGNIPFIFVSGGYLEDYNDVQNFYEANDKNAYIHKPIDFEELIKQVDQALGPKDDERNNSGYSHIHLGLLSKYSYVSEEIFLKISDDKFIKIKNSGDSSTEEIKKYVDKGNLKFYMNKTDFVGFMERAISEQSRKLLTSPAEVSEVEICGETLEILQDSLIQLGLTTDQLLLINTTIETCLDILGSEPALKEQLKVFLKGKGYFVSHSLTAAHICFLLANKLGMGQDSIVNKLLYSALLHDITLPESELCQIYDIEDPVFLGLDLNSRKRIKSHAADCVAILESSDKIPGDVLTIIKEHHELPNGMGFPRGSTETNIFGLSLIFIAALRMADHIFHHGHGPKSLDMLLCKLTDQGFQQGHCEKIYNEIEKIVKKAKS